MNPHTEVTKRTFYVCGLRPVDVRLNRLIQACNLGTDGAFVAFLEEATITLSPTVTERQRAQHGPAIKEAYEATGCVDVKVVEKDVMVKQ